MTKKITKATDPTILLASFVAEFQPEEKDHISLFTDERTGAQYCECHIFADKLIKLGTIDVPLDPEDQPEYRANRQLIENAPAYSKMVDDALNGRTFSNIVAEYNVDFNKDRPLKIIGGQHRMEAIRAALDKKINKRHGVKVYFCLNTEQRLDVQLISNTNIAASGDLFDRMHETANGPHLRNWCQKAGLLEAGKDFADKKSRTSPMSVQMVRTFILNYFDGKKIPDKKFGTRETTPKLCQTGSIDEDWERFRKLKPDALKDRGLLVAGQEYAALIAAQRSAFKKEQTKFPRIILKRPAALQSYLPGRTFLAFCTKTRSD